MHPSPNMSHLLSFPQYRFPGRFLAVCRRHFTALYLLPPISKTHLSSRTRAHTHAQKTSYRTQEKGNNPTIVGDRQRFLGVNELHLELHLSEKMSEERKKETEWKEGAGAGFVVELSKNHTQKHTKFLMGSKFEVVRRLGSVFGLAPTPRCRVSEKSLA